MQFRNYTKFIISPHLDDEILGCGGVIDDKTFILYCGMDEASITDTWVRERPSAQERIKELKSIQKFLNFKCEVLHNKVNHYVETSLISSFEYHINEQKPDMVFIPNPSYNQDHRTVYNASLVALRPHDINHFVKNVVLYEQIQDLQWDNTDKPFKPNLFIDIDIEKKIKAYKLYKTQVRKFRSPEMIKTLARTRGIQSNSEYAEAFEILRWKLDNANTK
jgi:LmbE family N-acetylglucosaminyl deacetylase